MSWFEEWFDENYLELYADRDPRDAEAQAELILRVLDPSPVSGKWLDVGCGTGRYTALFQERGYPITGIDISAPLIEVGKKGHPDLDIRNSSVEDLLQEETRYRVILSLFTSFGYYKEDGDNQGFLNRLGELAELGGTLWLDFLNSKKLLREPLSDTVFRGKSGKIFHQRRRVWVLPHPRIEKEIELYEGEGRYLKTYRESVRLYSEKDFRKMLPKAGFAIQEVFGDYRGGSYSATSPRLIIRAEKIRDE